MDFPTVLARLNDLPSTFRRNGPPYTQLIDSIARALAGFTLAADATEAQVSAFTVALDGWLDVWGLLWGVARQQNEANSSYGTRISRTVLAWVGTLPAIQAWVSFYAPGGTVVDNYPTLGYSITLPPTMTPAQVTSFLRSLNRIRPAGMPFTVNQTASGIFLGTQVFIGTGLSQAPYLTGTAINLALALNPVTPNTVPIIPTTFMSDPTINPSLAA
jgi:hypothetical protein